MKGAFQQLQKGKPTQRHKLLVDLLSQTPTYVKLALNRVRDDRLACIALSCHAATIIHMLRQVCSTCGSVYRLTG